MVDSIALVRRRIEDSSLAFQDETIDSVVTLAAIEVRCDFIANESTLLTNTGDTAWQGKHRSQQDAYQWSQEDGYL